MTQYIRKLPAVFQTVTEKKFFDATIDQVFSKKDSDLLSGYLGRRNPGNYNPITDFYLPEPTKNRTWWQLEATAYARDADATKTNIFFYEDLLERIEQFGGNISNQDRLFESEYYSFGPPIDYDMFTNYQNYYWIEQGLPTIVISGLTYAQFEGKSSFNTSEVPGALPADLTLSTGMTISLVDDVGYTSAHVVQNMGGCEGIRLTEKSSDFTAGTLFEFLPWDSATELTSGRIIDNTLWDAMPWEVQNQPGSGDYITIERGGLNKNAWSRTNKWYHIDVINTSLGLTDTSFPNNATRALRPIIQFCADLILYKSGTTFLSEISYGFRNDQTGAPILFSNIQSSPVNTVNTDYGISITTGTKLCFFEDSTVDATVFVASVNSFGILDLTPSLVASEGDILFVTADAPYDGAQRGETWYYSDGSWVKAFNDKTSNNQAPLFQLYDHNGKMLNDQSVYPDSTFRGSKIFSYKVNTSPGATVDPVLGFSVVYAQSGQTSDFVFQNNLITDRYTYGTLPVSINGYYYYKTSTDPVLYNNWNLYDICDCPGILPADVCNCVEVSKQRVIDKYTVGYGSLYQFKISAEPYGYYDVPSTPDIIVSVNGIEVKPATQQPAGYTFSEINGGIYVVLTEYLNSLFLSVQSQAPVVEIQTYTHAALDVDASGYFQIPQQLEANPTQQEITEINGSDLILQFSSIISNQVDFVGIPFGGINNYRDSRKNRSVGSYILQNIAPALKSMLVASSDDLDFIEGVRFSQDEYTKFKNKFLTVALQLINQGFDPAAYQNNTIILNYWVTEILKIVNISKEFSNAFAYSYMVANGTPFSSETITVAGNSTVTLGNYVDLSDPKNVMYIYDVADNENLLLVGQDYNIVSSDPASEIDVQFTTGSATKTFTIYLYKAPLPTYIPSTPTKVGAYGAYVPRIEMDNSYAIPTNVIIGHDGSKTIAYGDYRDNLLLELEKRIYNFLQPKYINEYRLPVRIESVEPGFYRKTRYTRAEYLDITESYLNKWSAKNRANYRVNDWVTASADTPEADLWKLYNYSTALLQSGDPANLPGNWKGIFQYYYDTYYPDTRPWEMLGFSARPVWWVSQYGTDWSSANTALWDDLEAGIIRQGPTAIFDPVTLIPQPQSMWARPGLSAIIPVDIAGNMRPVIEIFDLSYTGSAYAPFDGFDADWVYGDGGPVEQAWMSTSGYAYTLQEIMYLTRPAVYGELMWDTLGTEISPGMLFDSALLPGITLPVMSNKNWQYVQNDTYIADSLMFAWFRPRNSDQVVHAEIVDSVVSVRFGYQTWISDRILFLSKNIADTFGQKIRTLDVNLANKFAGFTNKDTVDVYLESVTPAATTSTLIIPSTDFDVKLHKSPNIDRYSYSGVIIRALVDGTFAVYGYDLLNSQFTMFDRSPEKLVDVSIGGTPIDFQYYESGATYNQGDIVRYNGVYYESRATQTVTKFDITAWNKLKGVPTTGGVSVSYKPISLATTTNIPYGSILKTPQAVFDLLIGWGAYLEAQGWQFDSVNQETNILNDWLSSAKQFLFWLNTNWAPDATIQLSPLANKATLIVKRGYPNDIETRVNGVYSILDKYGVAIPPNATVTDREGQMISAEPADLSTGGIYFLQVSASETEHILIFDNVTSFNDTLYSPLLRSRQQRIKFIGFRSNGWYGKMEAPGYLVIEDQIVPNFDTIVNSMRYFYDPNITIDNPSLEDLGRHLIGYESKSYLDNLQVADDVQYLFYQGAIRQKGTTSAFDKLFRSTKIQNEEIIEIYEEWALKVGDFGNTIEQVSTEFKLSPEQSTGEVIVARLNFVPSTIGSVRQINILNAENIYTTVPKVVISPPDAAPPVWSDYNSTTSYEAGDVVRYVNLQGNATYYSSITSQAAPAPNPGTGNSNTWAVVLETRQARAFAILDSSGRISRIDITDAGTGYTAAPGVSLNAGSQSTILDRLYSVWQGDVVKDVDSDNIVNIDIDQADKWVVRPAEPAYSLEFPVTNEIDYAMPNAGYVNFNDVDHAVFGIDELLGTWGTDVLNPGQNQTIWVAKTLTDDWAVYKLLNILPSPSSVPTWRVQADQAGNLLLLTNYSLTVPEQNTYILPQLWNSSAPGQRTDFGSLVVLQQVLLGDVVAANNYTLSFMPYVTEDYANPGTYTAPDTLITYNAYSLTTIEGTPVTATDISNYEEFTDLLLFKSLRFAEMPTNSVLPVYIGSGDLMWIDNMSGKWAVVKLHAESGSYWDADYPEWDIEITDYWGPVYYGWDAGALYPSIYRIQQPLINSRLFESASVFSPGGDELTKLPVYDPFKNILPGIARQNISYMTMQDPARYNVTGNETLFSENISFGPRQVGQLWWDLSYTRFVYYEQPIALNADGSPAETELENLIYRRDNWAQLFPGANIDIYEWVASPVPPEEYTGSGIPRDPTSYVQISTLNKFTGLARVTYYFWVLGSTNVPDTENRTIAAIDVARLLQTPKRQGYSFFAPIQQTSTNNSYMFYNVQEILSYKGDNVQVQYRMAERNDQKHTQWAFFREGDTRSFVSDQFWDKMTDSLCGYTKLLPVSEEYSNPIIIASDLPWDIYAWDAASWDSATNDTSAVYGQILPVPDPTLSEGEKFGIEYRPRQSMFVKLQSARKVFVQSANSLLKQIPVRDDNPAWDDAVSTSIYWTYTNWYKAGYEDVLPTSVYSTLNDASTALQLGELQLNDIVQVTNGTPDGRFILYAVISINGSASVLGLDEVCVENSAVKLLDTVYTVSNKYNLVQELRQLLNAFRTEIMIDEYIVYQNELFFSMLNYVVSEQKSPDWVFKSSYIYVKENNLPLTQSNIYLPDQFDNIISFIKDSKPYHTQVRDYTRTYSTLDVATGSMSEYITAATTTEDQWDTNAASASLIQPGHVYQITSVGETDWVAVGATSGTLGELFVATSTPVLVVGQIEGTVAIPFDYYIGPASPDYTGTVSEYDMWDRDPYITNTPITPI